MRFTATTRTVATLGATTALLAGIATATTAHAGSAQPQTWEPQSWEPQKAADVASVRGSAQIYYAYSANDTIRFKVDAQAAPFSKPFDGAPKGLPTDARGTLAFSHHDPDTNTTMKATAEVDCLVTGGKTATISAVIKETGKPDRRIGISFQQGEKGRPDRLGFSWGVANVHGLPGGGVGTCLAPAPFAPVVKGGYQVVHTELPPLPAGAIPTPKR